MTCPDCASERESRLRAEAEIVSLDDCADNYANRLATAERERDEARALASDMAHNFDERTHELAAAQRRADGLEAALQAWVRQYGHGDFEASRLTVAALSSPAVTAEGKKLGEEGDGMAGDDIPERIALQTELDAIDDVATGARPAEDFEPASGTLGKVILALRAARAAP